MVAPAGRPPELAQGGLERFGGRAVEPEHEVRVGAQAGDVVRTADDDAVLRQAGLPGCQLLRGDRVDGATRICPGIDGPRRVAHDGVGIGGRRTGVALGGIGRRHGTLLGHG